MKITQERMNALLDQFTKATNQKQYKRIPYVDWKRLKTVDTCFTEIVSDPLTGQISVVLTSKKGDILATFEADDKSFGEFLLTKILNEGEVKVMPPKNSNDDLNYYYATADNAASKSSYSTASTKLTYTGSPYIDSTITFNDYNQAVYNGTTGTALSGTYVTKDELDIALAKKADKVNKTEENKMKTFNFDFGPCSNNAVKMSLYGLAVKNSTGTWVSYDPKTESIVDVDILNFDGAKYLYKIPTAIKDIKAGDIVVHAGKPMFVTSIGSNSKSLIVVDPISGEKKEVMLTRSPFGFDFATKIVNFLGNFMDSTASADSPFGNMWMLMLASGENNGLADLAPLMLMNGNSGNMNPMMMYFMLSNGSKDNLLPLMFMMNSANAIPAAHNCACGGNCGKADTNA
jgi:hypothetical protein